MKSCETPGFRKDTVMAWYRVTRGTQIGDGRLRAMKGREEGMTKAKLEKIENAISDPEAGE